MHVILQGLALKTPEGSKVAIATADRNKEHFVAIGENVVIGPHTTILGGLFETKRWGLKQSIQP